MSFYHKYIKYKTKYLNFRHIQSTTHAKKFVLHGGNKTDVLAQKLKEIVTRVSITNDEYFIMASYCLKEMREVTDLDVVVLDTAYEKLKQNKIGQIDIAKISQDERIIVKLPEIADDAEIEFFPKKRNIGFPSNDFSFDNLQKGNNLIYDEYGNPYYDIQTCVAQYSQITRINDEYFLGDYKINKDRLLKNISHLKFIRDFYLEKGDTKISDMVDGKINKLIKLLDE